MYCSQPCIVLQAQISQIVHDIEYAPDRALAQTAPGGLVQLQSQRSSSLTLPSLGPPRPLGEAHSRSMTPSMPGSQDLNAQDGAEVMPSRRNSNSMETVWMGRIEEQRQAAIANGVPHCKARDIISDPVTTMANCRVDDMHTHGCTTSAPDASPSNTSMLQPTFTAASPCLTPEADVESTVDSILQQGSFWTS
jgi:hypothetical protein